MNHQEFESLERGLEKLRSTLGKRFCIIEGDMGESYTIVTYDTMGNTEVKVTAGHIEDVVERVLQLQSELDVHIFETFTREEYIQQLSNLGLTKFADAVGCKVYYVTPKYGIHTVESWNPQTGKYRLSLDGQRFDSTPFQIELVPQNEESDQ